jgi:hypothetical protein
MVQSNIISIWTIREASTDIFAIPTPPAPSNRHVDDVGSTLVFNSVAAGRPAVPVIPMDGVPCKLPPAVSYAARRDRFTALLQTNGDDHVTLTKPPAAGRVRFSRRLVLIGGNVAAWAILGGILVLLGAV